MSDEVLLEARGVQKAFQKGKLRIQVLRGVDLSIRRGETVAIVGASGAGKSTLLHILGTLDEPTSGTVLFHGKNIFAGTEESRAQFRNRHLGFVFQFHHLLPEFSALENVMMPGLIAGRDDKQLRQGAIELLQEVGLSHRLHHKPGELSGGESQRVAVARALMMKPELVLADEMTGNLDSENSENLIALLAAMNQRRGVSIIVVTHDLALARKMSRVIEIRDGRIVP